MNKSERIKLTNRIWEDRELVNELQALCRGIRDNCYLQKGLPKSKIYEELSELFNAEGLQRTNAMRDAVSDPEKVDAVNKLFADVQARSKKSGLAYIPVLLYWISSYNSDYPQAQAFISRLARESRVEDSQDTASEDGEGAVIGPLESSEKRRERYSQWATISAPFVAILMGLAAIIWSSLPSNQEELAGPSAQNDREPYPTSSAQPEGDQDQPAVQGSESVDVDGKASEDSATTGDEASNDKPDDAAADSIAENETSRQTARSRSEPQRLWEEITAEQWSTGGIPTFYTVLARVDRDALLEAASAGNAKALTLAGIGYYTGRGLEANQAKSRTFLGRACVAQFGRGCTVLAGLHSQGLGGAANQSLAIEYYDRGCQLGTAWACYFLGSRATTGFPTKYSVAQGIQFLDQACQEGIARSCVYAASLYFNGQFVERNTNLAQTYCLSARSLRWTENCFDYGNSAANSWF